MTRDDVIKQAKHFFDTGDFFDLLTRKIATPTPAGQDVSGKSMRAYYIRQLIPDLSDLGFTDLKILENQDAPDAPFLTGQRMEDPEHHTVLLYGHIDTVPGMSGQWAKGRSPYDLSIEDDKWYGRGTADNKGQHLINLEALSIVIRTRKKLGFNVKLLFESGEELGSPGLHNLCRNAKETFAADLLIASDGPRVAPDVPTIFGGSRAACTFDLTVDLRRPPRHSGNFGGILADPGFILAHALASLMDAQGRIKVPKLIPEVPPKVVAAVQELAPYGPVPPQGESPWGETDLSTVQKLYARNSLDILAIECGDPGLPANAIPGRARARCQIRYTADSDPSTLVPAVKAHLDRCGLSRVTVTEIASSYSGATRMMPDHPWVVFIRESLDNTLAGEQKTAFVPNIGGTIPNDAFSHILGIPTVWIPHSYAGCCQHAPDEHLLAGTVRQGLCLMAGLFWDLREYKKTPKL